MALSNVLLKMMSIGPLTTNSKMLKIDEMRISAIDGTEQQTIIKVINKTMAIIIRMVTIVMITRTISGIIRARVVIIYHLRYMLVKSFSVLLNSFRVSLDVPYFEMYPTKFYCLIICSRYSIMGFSRVLGNICHKPLTFNINPSQKREIITVKKQKEYFKIILHLLFSLGFWPIVDPFFLFFFPFFVSFFLFNKLNLYESD